MCTQATTRSTRQRTSRPDHDWTNDQELSIMSVMTKALNELRLSDLRHYFSGAG